LLPGKSGQYHLINIFINLPTIFDDIAQFTSEQATKKDLRIVTLFDSATPVKLKGDPDRLHQLLMDLVSYAIRCADHGDILIKGRVVKELVSSLSIDFSISFNSTVAFAARVPTIQKRLEDMNDSSIHEFGGIDLELFISQQLLKQMDSRIWVINSPENESRIAFILNFEREPQLTMKEQEAEFKGIRTLLVDNDPISRQVLTKMLNVMGCYVKSVASGAEVRPALVRGLITNLPFRVVLLDVEMHLADGVLVLQALRQDDQTRNTNIIVLMPAESRERSGNFPEPEEINVLHKPVRQSELHEVLESILGVQQERVHESKSILAERVARTRVLNTLKILLVDDDDLNLKMGNIVLSHLGHLVDMASSGAEAVAKVEAKEFDLVFMDVQMPQMNGLEATRRIRASTNTRKNIPIIAMTASDTTRFEKICLEAGMDDYISKPFNINRINQIVNAFSAGNYRKGLKAPKPEKTIESPSQILILDVSVGMSIFDNDIKLFEDFMREFLKSLPNRIEKMGIALNAKDWESLGNDAHNLKGISANLGVMRVSALATRLEAHVKERKEESVDLSFHELQGAISELVIQFEDLLSPLKKIKEEIYQPGEQGAYARFSN
jgi:CheY-like chemotaxis protein